MIHSDFFRMIHSDYYNDSQWFTFHSWFTFY